MNVAPIKRQTIPHLELCGAFLVSRLLHHCRLVLSVSLQDTFAWTNSTIVLSWLSINPRHLKTFVGNRISQIVDLIPPSHWQHVEGVENTADSASRGLLPSELLSCDLWWNGPSWLKCSMNY